MARPTKLTAKVQAMIVGAFFLDESFGDACKLAGVPESTGYEWLARGKGTHPTRRSAPRYVAFARALAKAGFVEAMPAQAPPGRSRHSGSFDALFAEPQNRVETTTS